jgi:crotonobetainyl-CoA:carnitine CoA-transferase CaiB-like acyl-CoA transferase
VTFTGRDPIVGSPLPFARMAAVTLMAKAVSVAELWRFRGGQSQDLSVNLGKALHRLCPFYDKKWELLNGCAPDNPADPKNPFMPTNMYRTRDNRRVLFMNIYPRIRSAALTFLGCNDDPTAIGSVIRRWDAFDLEEQANRAGLQATVVRSAQEFLDTEQCRYLEDLPLVHIEKIADSDPEPFTPRPQTPLGGVRALGFSHVIAGPGMGRGLAYHGADVLNLWTPDDFEMDFNYYSANVGMRSAIMDFRRPEEMARFRRLVTGADIFFANRLAEGLSQVAGCRWFQRLDNKERQLRTPQFSDYSVAHRLLNPPPILPRLGRSPRWHRRSERNTRCGSPVR